VGAPVTVSRSTTTTTTATFFVGHLPGISRRVLVTAAYRRHSEEAAVDPRGWRRPETRNGVALETCYEARKSATPQNEGREIREHEELHLS
jgi:hypothetical protein